MSASLRLVLPLLLTLSAVSCKSSEGNQEPLIMPAEGARAKIVDKGEPAETPKRIALVMKTLTNPFFVSMERGAHRAENELGIELLVRTHGDETAIEQQIAIVKKLIREGVDAMAVVPGNSTEMIPVVKEAQSAGIAIVNVDNRFDPETAHEWGLDGIPFVGVNNVEGARIAAEYLAGQLTLPAQVAIIEGDPAAYSSHERKQGALEGFAAVAGVDVVAVETAHWNIEKAREAAARIFEKFPDVRGVFCANDIMALGVIRFLEESGKHQSVLVTGYDAIEEARAAIRSGKLLATVDQRPDVQGYTGVKFAARLLAGETLPRETYIDVELVTAASLEEEKP
ncbi:substrate-binding domain-containing protein [Haliangium sp.]|uniref:substrate-binding domain-containing protein n=1 Tax=Haliangium sp. TaxID=2663208 RepID=UPI003D0D115B